MIRRLTHDDRETYIEFAKKFYSTEAVMAKIPERHFEVTFQELMRSEVYAECFLLVDGDQPKGYALIAKTFSQEAGGLVVWIEELYVEPDARSKGLGSEFFEFLEANIPAKRYRLEVEPENGGAVRLYRRFGFKEMPYGQMYKDI